MSDSAGLDLHPTLPVATACGTVPTPRAAPRFLGCEAGGAHAVPGSGSVEVPPTAQVPLSSVRGTGA